METTLGVAYFQDAPIRNETNCAWQEVDEDNEAGDLPCDQQRAISFFTRRYVWK